MKKLLSLLALVCVGALLLLTSCGGGCEAHVDADNDLLCDSCGEVFDDGITVTFTVTLEDGKALSGKKLILELDETRYELTLDENGQITTNVAVGIYETSVEGYLLTVDLIKVKQDTTSVNITAMDSTPDGSREKPFYINELETALNLAPGEEIFFNYRGSSVKYATVYSDDVVINCGKETFKAADGKVIATIQPGTLDPESPDSGRTTIFSVKNLSDEAISTVLYFEAPEGSSDNPFVLESNTLTVTVNADTEIYYVWTATKDGTLTMTVNSDRNDITVTKIMEDDVPEKFYTNGDTELSLSVSEGDEIRISVSASAPSADSDGQEKDVEISFTLEIN